MSDLNIFSSPNTLTNKSSKVKAGVKGDANLLRPTLMCAVPLILERIYKSIVDTMRRQGWAVEELFHYFVNYKMKWQVRFKLIGIYFLSKGNPNIFLFRNKNS